MRKRFLIVLFFFSSFAFGQVNKDYEIYSSVINSFMNNWDSSRIHLTNAVIIEKFQPKKNKIKEYVEMLYSTDTEFGIDNRNWHLQNDTSLIKLIQLESVEESLFGLKKNFLETPVIESEKLNLETPHTLISSSRYNSFFFLRKHKNGWKKYYKKFPKSAGVFSLSRIEYSENYACFYIEHMAAGLHGSGRIIILKKINNSWEIRADLEVWLA